MLFVTCSAALWPAAAAQLRQLRLLSQQMHTSKCASPRPSAVPTRTSSFHAQLSLVICIDFKIMWCRKP